MINKIKLLFAKYKSVIAYLFFGGCTTLVNIAAYYICYNLSGIPNVASTVIAWILSVIFAYITNKLWVFESKSFEIKILTKEIFSFFGCRLLTGILDVVIMYFAVDCMGWNSTLWKLLSNILVIILNYVASKLFIFKKNS